MTKPVGRILAEQDKPTTPRPGRTAPAYAFYRSHDAPPRGITAGGSREWHPYVFSDRERDVVRGALVGMKSNAEQQVAVLLGGVWPDWNNVTPEEMERFARDRCGCSEATAQRVLEHMERAEMYGDMLTRMDEQERKERGF